MFTRSFEGFKPPRRFDEVPFTQVTIGESATQTGFTTIETIDLDPVDSDPSNPAARNFTTDDATLAEGWYLVTWVDGSGAQFASDPVLFPAGGEQPVWAPQVANVASLLRARTKDDNMNEVGTFTDDTRPTASAVEAYIDQAVERIETRVGANLRETLYPDATKVAALYAAMLIELSYFPEQAAQADSVYSQLKGLYDEQIAELISAEIDDSPMKGIYSVPTAIDVPSYLMPPLP